VQAHFAAAGAAARPEHYPLYNMLCARLADPLAGKVPEPKQWRARENWANEPVRVFDNLYYLGEKDQWETSPSAWALNTRAGIILIDTLFGDSVEHQVVDGLRKVGLDPRNIKYVIVTHGHIDHYGGASLIQERFGSHVLMSAADWDYMYNDQHSDPKPKRDMIVKDGQTLTLGDTTVRMYVSNAHTPGTISLVFPVSDYGKPHLVAEWGGTGFNFNGLDRIRAFTTYRDEAARFRDIVTRAGADVLIANHSGLDRSAEKNAALNLRAASAPNPWVIGPREVQNYLTVAHECAAAGLASFH